MIRLGRYDEPAPAEVIKRNEIENELFNYNWNKKHMEDELNKKRKKRNLLSFNYIEIA